MRAPWFTGPRGGEDVGTIPILLEDQRPNDPPYHPLRESLWRIATGQAEYSGVAESATGFAWSGPHHGFDRAATFTRATGSLRGAAA